MSYCRFSSMNWSCNVYVYEDVSGGWTTHVAAMRRAIPPIPSFIGSSLTMHLHRWSGASWNKVDQRMEYDHPLRALIYRAYLWLAVFWHAHVHRRSLDLIPLRPINGPYDGHTFNDSSPGQCAHTLENLAALGYVVPGHVIEALHEEQLEMDDGNARPD